MLKAAFQAKGPIAPVDKGDLSRTDYHHANWSIPACVTEAFANFSYSLVAGYMIDLRRIIEDEKYHVLCGRNN